MDPILFPVGYSSPLYPFTYTPVLIKFVQPLIVLGSEPLKEEAYRIEIVTPDSAMPHVEQTIQKRVWLTIPASGVLKLRLVPSDEYTPAGIYRVSYYRKGASRPDFEQQWYVPRVNVVASTTVVKSDLPFDYIPGNPFEILNISHPGTYELDADKLYWTSNPPDIGSSYTITYTPSLTLDRLIYPSKRYHSSPERR